MNEFEPEKKKTKKLREIDGVVIFYLIELYFEVKNNFLVNHFKFKKSASKFLVSLVIRTDLF